MTRYPLPPGVVAIPAARTGPGTGPGPQTDCNGPTPCPRCKGVGCPACVQHPADRLAQAMNRLAQTMRDCAPDVGGARGTSAYDGSQWSGVAKIVKGGSFGAPREGKPESLLNCRRIGSSPLGGMATVQVHVTDVTDLLLEGTVNARTVMDLRWQSGRGGGEAQVDITRGAMFSITAADTVQAKVRIIPATDAAFALSNDKRVEASVAWGTSINPEKALGTSEGVTAVAGVPTARIPIPVQAGALMAVTTDPANYATLRVDFFRQTGGFGGSGFSSLNPFGNTTPIVSGAEAVSFTATANCVVIPVWVLHI